MIQFNSIISPSFQMHWFCKNKIICSIKFRISWFFVFHTRIKRICNSFSKTLSKPLIILAWILYLRHKLQSYDEDDRWTAMRKNSTFCLTLVGIFFASILTVKFIIKKRSDQAWTASIHIPWIVSLNSVRKTSWSWERFQIIKF